MTGSINVPVSSTVYARLQRYLALVDDPSSVIEKLIDHWEANPPKSTVPANSSTPSVSSTIKSTPELWQSPRGDTLRIGEILQAEYLGKTFRATVEKRGIRFGGKLYDSPSAAGVAAKGQLGRTGRTASTDGRTFWKIQDPNSGRWVSIASLRPLQHIDPDTLLAELAKS